LIQSLYFPNELQKYEIREKIICLNEEKREIMKVEEKAKSL